MTLSKEDYERYSRQIALKEIGAEGQKKLREAKVSIVGIGGLGCVSALQLTAMGVGYLRLIDQDVVDLTNLQRQMLYDVDSIGYPKVEVAGKKLKSLNPDVELELETLTVNSLTAEAVVRDVDLVIDGLDHFGPRYALNEACVKLKVPYVFGGAIEAYGNISTIIPGETACLECFLGRISDEGLPTCETVGVLPSILGIVASVQVKEALNLILGKPPSLADRLLFCDLNALSFEVFQVTRVSSCPTCGIPSAPRISEGLRVAELCGKNAFMVSPRETLTIDIAEATNILGSRFNLKTKAQFGITLDYGGGISISLMKTGNILVKGVGTKEEALKIHEEIMELLA